MLESTVFFAFLMGVISACSLPLGALTAFIWTPTDRVVAILMAFGGGALLAALSIDLVAKTVDAGHFNPLALGAIVGGLLFIALNELINNYGGFLRKASTTFYHLRKQEHQQSRRLFASVQQISLFDNAQWQSKAAEALRNSQPLPRLGRQGSESGGHGAPLAIWLGLALDGIPEALVIGASVGQSSLSMSLLAGLFLSNYPEALSSSVGMRQQGMRYPRILLMWVSLMLLTGVLAVVGSETFQGVDPSAHAFTEGLAAGAMLTMIAQTMLPEAYLKGGSVVGFSTLLGFLAAIAFK